MGATAYGGRGFKGRAAVSGERPIGAASCRQQHNEVSCQPPPPPHPQHARAWTEAKPHPWCRFRALGMCQHTHPQA